MLFLRPLARWTLHWAEVAGVAARHRLTPVGCAGVKDARAAHMWIVSAAPLRRWTALFVSSRSSAFVPVGQSASTAAQVNPDGQVLNTVFSVYPEIPGVVCSQNLV